MFAMEVHFTVYIPLTIITVLRVNTQGCETGWFGPGCRYMCHCLMSLTCDEKGDCPYNESCAESYFGPACQYVSLMSLKDNSTEVKYLNDNNETTCNPQANATSVEVYLEHPIPISWIRIIMNNPRNVLNFTIRLNKQVCNTERKFRVSPNVVDVTCDTHNPVTKIKIEGSIAPFICSLYITKGRNLALREKTQQSSTLDNQTLECGSDNAVDGNNNPDFDSHSCSHTDKEADGPEWRINFTWPVILNVVRVYNRNFAMSRLNQFRLRTYTSNFTRDSDLRGGIDLSIHDLILSSRNPIIYMTIQQALSLLLDEQMLTLCEVEAYGEYVCPHGTYGLFCEKKCACNKTEVCHVASGRCALGCSEGLYGYDCTSQCSLKCVAGLCEYETGYCLRCPVGYMGNFCTTECLPGTYGLNCKLKCQEECKDMCDTIYGKCICMSGFQGALCTECKRGVYGNDCNMSCPQSCSDGNCDQETGKCFSCVGKRFGPTCEECHREFYGPLCDIECPANCFNHTCNKDSGHCYQCKSNYKGDMCTECPDTYFGRWCDIECSYHCVNGTCDQMTGKCHHCGSGYSGDKCDEYVVVSPYWLLMLLFFIFLFVFLLCIHSVSY